MIILSTLLLLISNAVSLRRDMAILYNRIAIIALLYAILQSLVCFSILSNGGIGIHGGLFHVTNITQVFHIFLYLVSILIIQLTSIKPLKVSLKLNDKEKNNFMAAPSLVSFQRSKYKFISLCKFLLVSRFSSLRLNSIFSRYGVLVNQKRLSRMIKKDKREEHLKIIEYPLILLFIISGAVFLMSTNDFISVFLSIELQSYGLYLLSTIYRNSELSTTGGLIYFLLGGLSSCFILLGTSLLYANSGTTNMDSLYVITSISDLSNGDIAVGPTITPWYNADYINFSLLIFTIGFLFKVSAAPFHFWSPDKEFWTFLSFGGKLSNSGDTLKLLIPNHIWKYMSGWSNYSGMVTRQKIFERSMGYRGSKSVAVSEHSTVKEQRVYGNWSGNILPYLRCTLMGFERNYQVKNLSKLIIQKQLYSTYKESFSKGNKITVNSKYNLTQDKYNLSINEPWFVTGFADAEGCFMIIVRKTPKNKTGWQLEPCFVINLHKRDLDLLKGIQSYFGGVGRIGKERNGCCDYTVSSLEQILAKILPHFDKYTLKTQKLADYLLFKEVVFMMKAKEHLTVKGLQKIINIRATLNKGLTPALKESFPNSLAVPRPQLPLPEILELHPQWVAGFCSGDGSFKVNIRVNKGLKVGGRVTVIFVLTRRSHIRDELLLKSLVSFFGCGKAYSYKEHTEFISQNFKDNYDKILPFFSKYQVLGVKSLDFQDWAKVAEMIKNKTHLTDEGYNRICLISKGMNKGRYL